MEFGNTPFLNYPLKTWIPKQFFLNYTAFFAVTFLILAVFYFIQVKAIKNRKLEKKQISVDPPNITFPTHLNFRWVELPILEGLSTLWNIQKYGVEAISKIALKYTMSPGFQLHFGPVKTIVLTNAEMCQKVLSSTDPGHLNKPQAIYDRILISRIRNGLISSKFNLWTKQRNIISRAFTYRALNSYAETMNNHAKNLVREWLEPSISPIVEGKELYNPLLMHMVDITVEVIMGTGQCSKDDCNNLTNYYHKMKEIVIHRFFHAELCIAPIWWFHPNKWKLEHLINGCYDLIMTIIQKYKNEAEFVESSKLANNEQFGDYVTNKKDMKCLIEYMLSEGATPEEISWQIGTFLIAAHDSTVVALKNILFDLALHPHHQTKCRAEVDKLFQSKSLKSTDLFNISLEMDEITNLKHLERCILESLRLTPVVPFFFRNIDTPLKVSDELSLQHGTVVLFSPWLIHRDERYYPNPKQYDPSRFEPEEIRRREPCSYIPFSAYTRNCIGWKFALMEIKILMAWILRHFIITTVDNREDVKILFCGNIMLERDYRMRLERRNL